MKNYIILLLSVLILMGCKKHHDMSDMPMSELNINYPAAYVVNGESNSISVIDLSTNTVKETISLGTMSGMNMSNDLSWPHHIYMSPDKSKLLVAAPGEDFSAGHIGGIMGMTGKFAVIDAVKGTILHVVNLPGMNHNAIYSPDGTEIWTSKMDSMGQVLIYNASNYTLKTSIDVKRDPAEITFSHDGMMAFVANGSSDTVTLIDPSTKGIMANLPVGADPVGAWPAQNGKMYVDNEMGQTVNEIDVMFMTVTDTLTLGFMPGMSVHNHAMSELWVSDPDNGLVHYYTLSATHWVHGGSFATGAGAHAIAFSNNGMTAYVSNQMAASVSVVNVMTHQETKEITVGTKPNGILLRY